MADKTETRETRETWDYFAKERDDRAFDLEERKLAAQLDANAALREHNARAFDPTESLSAFFDLPPDIQDAKRREFGVLCASRLGGPIEVVLSNADAIAAYVKDGSL
jgi:hypothetical protein